MGYEVRQYTPLHSFAAAREELLQRRGVDVVLDVGANAGQYGSMLRELGFAGRLVSLEPVAEAFAELERLAAADGAWEAVRVAASDADGEITLNVTADSRSSSVLARNERFADKAGWAPKESRRVPARRLDGLVGELLRPGERAHLKLDIQGYERHVLAGAGDALGRFEALELELSVTPLYVDQPQLAEMLPLLAERGFRPVCLEPILLDDDGLLMELDGLFART
jgi:FkbM family methyltransferase